jgi:hypothetical protein
MWHILYENKKINSALVKEITIFPTDILMSLEIMLQTTTEKKKYIKATSWKIHRKATPYSN